MTATRLLVLGVVRMHGAAHGYQVRRELLTWSADKWANVQPGSIYHALKKMTAEKLLEQVETENGAGPDRTAYRLTEDGETEFQVLLAKYLSQSGDPDASQDAYRLGAALTFLTALPRERAISLLRQRATQMEGQRAAVADVLDHGTSWGQPEHVTELYRLWGTQVEATVGWARDLITRLEAGEYVMADDPGRSFGESPQ
ncbi:DNA-binding PadR family transcriptional regulator [Amycolatopsis bartoniae]|uniref:PadR family transcriptional regulator n=1 Tax=Amycolatopsis bartoniae TaxID=941986 RepID=A0A8H9IX67_9PSEU|nr:PadR family transcriptional regulator [Amycolatopsis bartoniae]MBB2934734.1 DNA-binding PadR family transcriptional regulator [Amycolatopsis bartoniae]TVT01201.1 PadR family transcriptional regulator [Amycolatopsis bartoniae]GHF45160.1 PadR family transcriptional regulator [Amycolatopsis bartoniae]